MKKHPATRNPSLDSARNPVGNRDRRSPASGGDVGGEDLKIPDIPAVNCYLLAMVRAHIKMAQDQGESLVKLSERINVPLGTMRKWAYQATSGDAAQLEHAIAKMGGASIEIPPQ